MILIKTLLASLLAGCGMGLWHGFVFAQRLSAQGAMGSGAIFMRFVTSYMLLAAATALLLRLLPLSLLPLIGGWLTAFGLMVHRLQRRNP